TSSEPERTTPNGPAPGRAKRATPAVCTTKPALAWRYPRRTPAAVKRVSPPAPGSARAASAASERGSTPAALRTISPATPGGPAAVSPDSSPEGGSSLGAARKTNCTAIAGSDELPHAWVVAQKTAGAIHPSGADQGAMPA